MSPWDVIGWGIVGLGVGFVMFCAGVVAYATVRVVTYRAIGARHQRTAPEAKQVWQAYDDTQCAIVVVQAERLVWAWDGVRRVGTVEEWRRFARKKGLQLLEVSDA